MFRISASQIVDLVEVEFIIVGGVQRYAVIDSQRDVSPFKEVDQIIEVFLRCAPGRDDHWPPRPRDLLQQRPIVHIRARDLYDGHVEVDTEVHRRLIERRGHGQTRDLLDLVHETGEILLAELRRLRLLDVAGLSISLVARVDETLHVAELELHGRLYIVVPDDGSKIADDLKPTFHLAPMIVGDLEHEQILEQVFLSLRNHLESSLRSYVRVSALSRTDLISSGFKNGNISSSSGV